MYDFAGHREFYSGHAALLQTAVQSTPPIFLLVVNLCDKDDEIIQTILYWISFLENQCILVSCKPHVIIVGSHADTLKSRRENPQKKVAVIMNSLHSEYFINLEFISFVAMDCQYHESAGMSDLRRCLVRSCNELRIEEPIPFNAHCFYVYLIEKFIDLFAVTISAIHERIEGQQLPQTKENILEFLPKDLNGLYRVCIELNDRGHILFLKDKMNAENSYVVIDQKSFLSEVSGTVFAPEDFKQHKQLATNTGVVPLSKIKECFLGRDHCILVGFLVHLEYCHEVSDQAICQLLSEQYSQTFNERYYLFPALISVTANDSVWKTESHFDHYFGWSLQCTILEQFFGSRFLQVLLLRLAFSFA